MENAQDQWHWKDISKVFPTKSRTDSNSSWARNHDRLKMTKNLLFTLGFFPDFSYSFQKFLFLVSLFSPRYFGLRDVTIYIPWEHSSSSEISFTKLRLVILSSILNNQKVHNNHAYTKSYKVMKSEFITLISILSGFKEMVIYLFHILSFPSLFFNKLVPLKDLDLFNFLRSQLANLTI